MTDNHSFGSHESGETGTPGQGPETLRVSSRAADQFADHLEHVRAAIGPLGDSGCIETSPGPGPGPSYGPGRWTQTCPARRMAAEGRQYRAALRRTRALRAGVGLAAAGLVDLLGAPKMVSAALAAATVGHTAGLTGQIARIRPDAFNSPVGHLLAHMLHDQSLRDPGTSWLAEAAAANTSEVVALLKVEEEQIRKILALADRNGPRAARYRARAADAVRDAVGRLATVIVTSAAAAHYAVVFGPAPPALPARVPHEDSWAWMTDIGLYLTEELLAAGDGHG